MSEYGVTPEGFVRKSLDEILAEMKADTLALFGPEADVTATSLLGQYNGLHAERSDELWAVAQSVYRAEDPDAATDDALENVCALTAIVRQAAQKSLAVGVICTGDDSTFLGAGRVASIVGSGVRFASTDDVTLTSATPWAGSTVYVAGDIRTNDSNIYIVTTGGTSAVSGGPTGEGADIIDNTVHWRFVGDGTAYGKVDFEAEETGPINASAYTLTVIETPVAGWLDVANPTDAEPGRNVETDEALRLRREQTIRSTGSTSTESIASRVRNIDGVNEAFIFENVTLATVDGLPPKSFEVVVDGGEDADIANVIFSSKPTGIESYGSTTVYVLDSQGTSHAIKFSRPEQLLLYVDLTVEVNAAAFPNNGIDEVKKSIVAKGDELGIGDDVIVLPIRAAPVAGSGCPYAVPGVIDVSSIKIDTESPPVNEDNIVVSNRQLAVFDTSRVTVAVE